MRRCLPLAFAALTLAGCGTSAEPPGAEPPPAATGASGGEPTTPPPKLDIEGPPPAWIETGDGSFWLAYSSYCWETACADYVAPSCAEARIPKLVVDRGEEVRFQLPFEPTSTELSFFQGEGAEPEDVELRTARDPTWIANRGGPFVVRAAADGHDAAYAGCIRIRGESSASGLATPVPGEALSVEEALAFGDHEQPVLVEAMLIAETGEPPRLCGAVAESYPPQCGEPTLVVRGLDLERLPGLERADDVAFGEVRLLGTVQGNVLTVGETAIASP